MQFCIYSKAIVAHESSFLDVPQEVDERLRASRADMEVQCP